MSKNLWQVVNYDDLLYFLRGGQKKFIVLSMVLLETDDNLKRMIKKFIKSKAAQFPHITFLYYVTRKEDFGRNSFLTKDPEEYPKLCHIYNVTEMLTEVLSIDNIEIMEKSFQRLEKYYSQKEDNEIFQSEESERDEREPTQDNVQHTQNSQSVNANVPQQSLIPTINPITERKKLLEKLTLLRDKAEECSMDFLKECQKRKKEEEKLKTKNKK